MTRLKTQKKGNNKSRQPILSIHSIYPSYQLILSYYTLSIHPVKTSYQPIPSIRPNDNFTVIQFNLTYLKVAYFIFPSLVLTFLTNHTSLMCTPHNRTTAHNHTIAEQCGLAIGHANQSHPAVRTHSLHIGQPPHPPPPP